MSDITAKAIRSPSYPSMSLRDALHAVGKIESVYRSTPVDRETAAKLIGYSSLSGPAAKALAALAAYGLFDRAGKGEARVAPRAVAILYAANEDERRLHLLEAASEPPLFSELRDRFSGIAVPPESGVVTYLNRQGFNPNAVRPAANAFLETMRFVEELKASESHGPKVMEDIESSGSKGASNATTFGGAVVGDLVQWESQGALQFPKPLRVRFISDDGEWVVVEGSQTGIPMSEVIVESKAPTQKTAPTFHLPLDEQSLSPAQGEVEWIRSRLSGDTNVRLLVKGDMGPKEIGKLIRLLEAQKLVLEED
ncbi:hypothetical protein ACFYE9_07820 [Rhizobium leguminosarum]|uniref:Uncharacterized protein n=2 Tax=Rhizobium leguminosarum TaxID=384 RepID=A0A154IME7_RHILE|nr:hypothetical protein [Rhizobium leguminosarum]KZB01308.1 hypothetical protein A4A59_13820 [Rhizobium leguminosarum]